LRDVIPFALLPLPVHLSSDSDCGTNPAGKRVSEIAEVTGLFCQTIYRVLEPAGMLSFPGEPPMPQRHEPPNEPVPLNLLIRLGFWCGRATSVSILDPKESLELVSFLENFIEEYPEYHEIEGKLMFAKNTFRHLIQHPSDREEIPDPVINSVLSATSTLYGRVLNDEYEKEAYYSHESKVIADLLLLHFMSNDLELMAMLQEAITCLKSGANRAAVVMVWSMTYDFVRKWIFSGKTKRLKLFNAVLTTKWKNKSNTTNHDPILTIDDFEQHGERFVIDIAYEAKLFKKHQYKTLVNSLDDRNQFAHPTGKSSTQEGAYGYISNLLVNVLSHKHFMKRPRKK
jgi:hypothetical protein